MRFVSSSREKSRPGSTPCVSRFSASVTRSTFPVRSPLPNSVPSTRSPPAISPSSAVATAVPRSLCGCTERMIESRCEKLRANHSIRSAYTFGGKCSTVVGRLTIIFASGVGPPFRGDGFADVARVFELRVMEALGRVLEHDLRIACSCELLAHRRPAHGERSDSRLVEPEHDAALRRRGRVVEVHDRAARAGHRFERALDQLRPRLRQHRDRHVVGNEVVLDEQPHEIEVRLRCRREADLDLLEAELEEQVEETPLARSIHRADERLVPIAEVGRAPDRRLGQDDVRPGSIGQIDGLVWAVSVMGHRHCYSFGLLRLDADAPVLRR